RERASRSQHDTAALDGVGGGSTRRRWSASTESRRGGKALYEDHSSDATVHFCGLPSHAPLYMQPRRCEHCDSVLLIASRTRHDATTCTSAPPRSRRLGLR